MNTAKQVVKMTEIKTSVAAIIKDKSLYFALLLLCGSQIVAVVQTHSLSAKLTLCDTIMFAIIMCRKMLPTASESLDVFLRLSGAIAFEALIFVTFTHGLEIVVQGSHEMHLPPFFIGVTICDVIIKTLLLITCTFPTLGLDWPRRIILHYTASIAILALHFFNVQYGTKEIDYLTKIDPYVGIVLSVILTMITIPTAAKILPFFMANKPTSFRVEDFSKEIEDKFPDVRCSHIHVYKKWHSSSKKKFDVFMHIDISFDQSSEAWVDDAQDKIQQVIKELKSILIRAGAHKVTIEPRIHGLNEQASSTICTDASCQDRKLTCCNAPTKDKSESPGHSSV